MITPKEAKRIFPYIAIDQETGCWNWTRQLYEGYGRIYFRGRPWHVHRVLFLWRFGELPEYGNGKKFVIDHTCKNRACCNPDHLQILSNKDNVLGGDGVTAKNSRKKFCKRGHELTPRKGGGRVCLTCKKSERSKAVKREYDKEYRKRKKLHRLASSQSL